MTDTGQVPGEGLPENAGMVEQPGVPAPDAYTYLSDSPAEEEDLLLPGAQSAWGNEIAPPAPEPVVETVHEPGPHETAGRDSGSVDLGGVRLPEPPAPRRPLHLGPPIPRVNAGPVRSLADRGPADVPVRQAGPPSLGPEYLDVPHAREAAVPQAAAPWGAQPAVAAETVVPAPEPVDAAQAVVTRVATEAGAVPQDTGGAAVAGGSEAVPNVSAEGGEQGPVPVPTADHGLPGTPAAEPVQGAEATQASAPAPELTPPAEPAAPEHVREAEAPPAAEAPSVEPAEPEYVQAAEVPQAGRPPVAVPDSAQAAVPEYAPGADASHGAQVPGLAPAAPQDAQAADAEPAVPTQDAQAPAAAPDHVQEAEAPQTVQPSGPQAAAPEFAQQSGVPQAEPVPGGEAVVPQVAEVAGVPQAEPVPGGEAVVPQVAEASQPGQAPDAEAAVPQAAQTVGTEAAEEPEAVQAVPAPDAEALAPEHVRMPEASPDVPAPAAGTAVLPGAPAAEADDTEGEAAAPVPGATGDEVLAETPMPEAPAAVGPEAPRAADETADAVPATDTVASEPDEAPVQGPRQTPAAPLTGAVPPEPEPDRPAGESVPVDGAVAAAPHPAPTPPQGVAVPAGEPRDADAEPAQNPDDLDTRGAGVDTEAARPTGPAAPGYDDAEREAVLKVMRERRDIRNGFRSDPIPHEVLLRVLEAAHTAPSVGHSQPWDFVVIRSAETRRSMHELAVRQRDAYAKSLPKGRAKQFKELKIEAILDTPVNIVVTADPTRGGRHTLGRHTQPQMAPYSSALAVENLWLAARAEGLGVGWVSFFDEREMVRALGLPEHLEIVAYLCVGYVDEFPDEPELMQAGWSKRRPLSWVVHEETYGRRALPGEDPHDLLAETVAQIRPLDAKALGEAWERQKRMTKPAGALGMLEIISAQLSGLSRQCPPPVPEPAAVAIFAGDHGVHAQGVTPWPQEVTAQMVANFLGGGAVCNAFAAQVGAEVCVVDVGVSSDLPATPGLLPRKIRAGTSDMTTGPAMTREEAKKAIEVGIETARDLVAAGNKALLTGEMGIANTTASAALISVFTGADPAEVTGRGTGINDETLARKTEVVRRALELHQPDPADPVGVLAAVGGFEHAAMVGLLLGGASLRTPVILDGVSAGAAALVARAVAPEVLAACIAGHRSAEPGHVAALNKLGLRPLVDLDLRLGEGTGALLALPLVQSTARAMHEVATFDSAGVTEK
ncbi:nicotinate-nucleotide--dimethylbenzimidazole phosphoribosyltransferase [Streptomyces sp. XY152]|uniref:nicotinate-nucleotide--dimethylbenzimidazole phosphoribosyltransferase n=1 Tax=Streptomyces sp. XY152 TaxID=1415560 RepID=UPI0006ADD8D2|nr:nicotinate-nucleotide--dimethylbenzimidazole phosphoribosyltransferase [Streptomyces sp. XY152]KOV20388.1 nicotinate-nucleotide--dimethylbenzimidazole phosphoribosyltransferase [Streptomyces sp. XY152]